MELDLFGSFPLISVRFDDVQCKEVTPFPKNNLFAFKHIYASLNIWQILQKDYSIKELQLDNGEVHLKIFADGSNNYHFWKTGNSDSETSLELEKVTFNKTKFMLEDQSSDVSLSTLINNLELSGSLWKSTFTAHVNINTNEFNLLTNGIEIITNAEVRAKSGFEVNEQIIGFNDGHLQINQLLFDLSGSIQGEKSDWVIQGNKLSLKRFIQLIPTYWLPQKSDLDVDGTLSGNVTLLVNNGNVAVQSKLNLKNGTYQNKTNPLKLSNISVLAEFSNGKKSSFSTSSIHLENFKGKTATGGFFCDVDIKNFTTPSIVINGDISMNAEELLNIVRPDIFDIAKGKIDASFTAQSSYKSFADIQESALREARFSGTMNFKDGVLKFKDANFSLEEIEANLTFNSKDIDIQNLSLISGNSNITANGSLKNVLYFTEERPRPVVKLNIQSNNVDVYELAHWKFGETEESSSDIPFDFNTTLSIQKFSWQKFKGENLKGNISGTPFAIAGQSIRFNSNDGGILGSFTIDKTTKKLTSNSQLTGIDIHSLFQQFENFGQEDIVANNIYGQLNSTILFESNFSESWEIKPSSIAMTSNIEINNGRLVNYEPLKSMSRYADEEDLKDVHFSKIKNRFAIKNSTISFPLMHLESNALSLDIEGSHDFESNIDYRIRMQLGLALTGKKKKKKLDDWIIEEDRPDQAYIWVKVGCKVDDPCVSVDKSKTGKDIINSITNEGEDWKALKNKPNKKEDPNEGELIFTWEEEPDSTLSK